MKTTETKTASSHNYQSKTGNQPFFEKAGEHSFFSEAKPDIQTKPFFYFVNVPDNNSINRNSEGKDTNHNSLTEDITNDVPSPIVTSPPIQTKCAECEAEEKEDKLQRKEEEKEREEFVEEEPQIQEKPIFESEAVEENIQTKSADGLTVGEPDDKYEQEADAMADQVVQKLSEPEPEVKDEDEKPELRTKPEVQEVSISESDNPETAVGAKPTAERVLYTSNSPGQVIDAAPLSSTITTIQPKCEACEKEEQGEELEEQPELQKKEISSVSQPSDNDSLQDKLSAKAGRGSSIDDSTRNQMESGFGVDFSNVNIHTDSQAIEMNKSLNAQAFTHGSDIYFNEGKYSPQTTSGKHLLAHELTHTVQQGGANIGPSVQKLSLEDLRRTGSSVVTTVHGGVNYIGNTVSGVVDSGIESIRDVGDAFIRETLERFVPGLWNLLRNGISGELKRKIFESILHIVRGLKTRIENSDFVTKIRDFFSQSREKLKQFKNEITRGCNSFYEKIDALVSFIGELVDPGIQKIKEDLRFIGQLASGLWDSIGKPAWDAIRELAGSAWDWLQSTALWIWDQTAPIRNTISEVWDWVKTQLGLLQDSAASIWDRFKEIALEVWDEIKPYIEPVLKPLKTLGLIILMLTPLGPVLAIYHYGPRIWESLKWIVANWSGWQTLLDLKEYFANEILPAIANGAQLAKKYLQNAVAWVDGIIESIKKSVREFLNSIGVLQVIEGIQSFVADLQALFIEIKAEFDSLIDSLLEDFNSVLTLAKSAVSAIWECIKPVLDFVLGIVLLAINPFLWPVYAAALLTRLAWYFLPDDLKVVAIDYVVDLLREALEYLKPPGIHDQIWDVFKSGATSFLDRLNEYSPDEKIHFVDKILNLLIDPRTYAGYLRGLISGFLHQAWTLVSGVISLSFSMPGIIAGIVNFFRNLVPDMATVERMLDRITEISNQLQEILNREKLFEHIMNRIMSSPQVLADWIAETAESAAEFAENTGRDMAEQLFNFVNNMDNSNVGYRIGDIVGRILFEVLLTKGIGFVIGKMVQGVAWLRRFLVMLRSGARRGAAGLLRRIKNIFSSIMGRLRTLFRRLSDDLGRLFESFKRLLDDFIAWIMRALRRGGERLGDTVQNRLRWELFEQRVALFTSSHRNIEGYGLNTVRNGFQSIFSGFRDVARLPLFPVGESDQTHIGLWELRAIKKFGLNRLTSHIVGYMPMTRRRRYRDNPVIGMEKRIRTDGSHEFKIEGNLNEPRPYIYSRPQTLNRLLNRRREELFRQGAQEENLTNKQQALNRLFQQKIELGRNIARYKSAIDTLYRPGGGRSRIITDVYNEIRNLVTAIVRNLEIVGIDVESINIPESHVIFNPEGRRPKEMIAEPLTKIPGNTRGQTPIRSETILGWDLIDVNLRNRGAWVRAHLLSHRLHGPGTWRNLFPGTRQMNLQNMELRVERPLKRLVWNRDRIMYYTVNLTYGNTGVFQNIPIRVYLEYGDFDPRTRRRSRLRRIGFSQEPPTSQVSNSINNGTVNGLNTIARVNGFNRMNNFFRKLVRQRNIGGNYLTVANIQTRLSNVYTDTNVLQDHVNNLRTLINNDELTLN